MSNELHNLRVQRDRLWTKLDNSGGRGVEIADEIDALDRQIAVIESGFDVDAFIDGYIECMAWADALPLIADPEHPEHDGTWQSGGMEGRELAPGVRATIVQRGMLVDFVEHNVGDLALYCEAMQDVSGLRNGDPVESYAGHDFYLTRAGHGAGYWDRGLRDLGERLSEAARTYGSPDDHMLYEQPDGTLNV